MVDKKLQHVEEDARRLADSLQDLMQEGKEVVGTEARHFLSKAHEHWEETRDFAKAKGKQADRFAHEHVWETAAIAAVVGAALAWLVGSRRERR